MSYTSPIEVSSVSGQVTPPYRAVSLHISDSKVTTHQLNLFIKVKKGLIDFSIPPRYRRREHRYHSEVGTSFFYSFSRLNNQRRGFERTPDQHQDDIPTGIEYRQGSRGYGEATTEHGFPIPTRRPRREHRFYSQAGAAFFVSISFMYNRRRLRNEGYPYILQVIDIIILLII
ncbi:uncharacterized protein LOC124369576 [Homalodisca vitripennis]|uniref:uncharacterized protein LOC124369576 n=1 Tax=Homalodisca vitripennis TaxID=197043 RepID=UPI001EEC4E59|nr:uncharacterized protein LOC124369576 [Homalodisca vitripennis]